MKILMVGLATFEQMAGGSARYLSGLSSGLREMGHEVAVRTAAQHVPSVGYIEKGFLGQLRRLLIRLLVSMPTTLWAVLVQRPDVVNVHFALDGLPTVVARLRGTALLVTFHGPWAAEALSTGRRGGWPLSTRARHAIEGFVYRRAGRCIVLSRAFGEVLSRRYGVDERRIRIIPGGIDTSRFGDLPSRATARRLLGLPEAYTIVTVRRLVPRMGLDLAVDALARLVPDLDAVLAIAGSGPERDRLELHAKQLGIGERVHFLGRVPEEQLALVYAAGDVCVVPSRELEGFGYVALEALASGLPVIATGIGGLGELVGGFEPRWIADADGGSFASIVKSLATEREIYPDPAACRRYAASMDWSRVIPLIAGIFEEAIDEVAPRRLMKRP
jgi:glycosyltransferase involved in cell wall biosynthesis